MFLVKIKKNGNEPPRAGRGRPVEQRLPGREHPAAALLAIALLLLLVLVVEEHVVGELAVAVVGARQMAAGGGALLLPVVREEAAAQVTGHDRPGFKRGKERKEVRRKWNEKKEKF